MEGKISLAWAIEVDHAQLGARLEAYIETKAAVTTLGACLSRYRLPQNGQVPERNLPQEVVDLIVHAVQDAVYKPRVQAWTKARNCVLKEGETLHHFSGRDVADYDWIDKVSSRKIKALLGPDASERHDMTVRRHLRKITLRADRTNAGNFARYRQILESELHIYPYFTVLPSCWYEHGVVEDRSACVSAFFALPVVNVPVESEPGIEKAFYTVQERVDTADISCGPSIQVQEMFKKAVKALRLEEPHTKIKKVFAHADDHSSLTSSSGESESDMYRRSSAPESAEMKGATEGDEEDLDEDEDDPKDTWRWPGRYGTYCIDCGDRICKGKYQAPEPALMMLASGEMKAYSTEY